MNLTPNSESERHCYKCNEYKDIHKGAMHRDGRGRRRFVCAQCLIYIPGPHKLLSSGKCTAMPAAA